MTLPDPLIVREWLVHWQFWWLELLFLAFILSSAAALPALVRAVRAPLTWWMALVAIAGSGVVAAYALPPTTNRIYYDEQIYQHVGQNLADLRRSQMCNHGLVEYDRLQCLAGEYNKEPYGYPHLLGVGYRIFGTSDALAHHVNRWLHGLLALVLGLLAMRWTGREAVGLMAAAVISLLPEQLRWSATAAAEPAASCFAAIAVLAAVEYARSRTTRALVWLLAATAWAIQMRPESGLIVGVVAAIVALEAASTLRERRTWWAALAGLGVLAVYGLHLLAVRNESWGAGGAPFALAHLWTNLPTNAWFYFADGRFPFWLGPLALVGLAVGPATVRARATIGLYFVAFWGIFLFFYAGSYDYGADVRYSLVSYAPLALLGALGVTAMVDRLAPAGRRWRAWLGSIAAIAWIFVLQAPHTRSIGEEAWAARADVAFAREFADRVEPDALVLTHNPNMFLLWGVNAAQLHFGTDPQFLAANEARHGSRIYVHWGFWCNVPDAAMNQLCETALTRAEATLVEERDVRNYRFAFYRRQGQTGPQGPTGPGGPQGPTGP